ncbi:MAG: hypothetical protein ABI537_08575, partial [Casimicrobiaceae bacterium]
DLERRRLMDRDRLANSMAGRETATADLYRAVVGALPPYADLHQFRVLSRGICERTVELFQHAFRSCLYPHRVRAKSVPKIPDLWTWVGIDAGLSEVIEVTVGASAGYAAPEFSPEHAAQLLTMRPRGFCLNVFDDSIDLLDAFGAAYLDSGSRPQLPVDPLLEAARTAAQRGSAPQ